MKKSQQEFEYVITGKITTFNDIYLIMSLFQTVE